MSYKEKTYKYKNKYVFIKKNLDQNIHVQKGGMQIRVRNENTGQEVILTVDTNRVEEKERNPLLARTFLIPIIKLKNDIIKSMNIPFEDEWSLRLRNTVIDKEINEFSTLAESGITEGCLILVSKQHKNLKNNISSSLVNLENLLVPLTNIICNYKTEILLLRNRIYRLLHPQYDDNIEIIINCVGQRETKKIIVKRSDTILDLTMKDDFPIKNTDVRAFKRTDEKMIELEKLKTLADYNIGNNDKIVFMPKFDLCFNFTEVHSLSNFAIEASTTILSFHEEIVNLRYILSNTQPIHNAEIPREFIDETFDHLIMDDPVFAMDGFTYNRKNIEEWFRMGKKTSPATGEALINTLFIPNHSLRSRISNWRSHN